MSERSHAIVLFVFLADFISKNIEMTSPEVRRRDHRSPEFDDRRWPESHVYVDHVDMRLTEVTAAAMRKISLVGVAEDEEKVWNDAKGSVSTQSHDSVDSSIHHGTGRRAHRTHSDVRESMSMTLDDPEHLRRRDDDGDRQRVEGDVLVDER